MADRTVLCIAYHFPPAAVTGTHRTRAVARYLPTYGWRPIIVTTQDGLADGYDPELLANLPPDLVVYRTPAPNLLDWGARWRNRAKRFLRISSCPGHQPVKGGPSEFSNGIGKRGWMDWLSYWMQLPDLAIGWLPWGLNAACRAVYRHGCQGIYSTAPYFTAHLIGLLTKRLTRRPWVADFRDPWRGNPFREFPYAAVDRCDIWLESCVVREADWVICNSHAVQESYAKRFPALARRFVTVPNGFDPDDFLTLKPRQPPEGSAKLVLTHAGAFYGPRRPHALFQAIRLLRERSVLTQDCCLQLLGLPTYDGQPLERIAADFGVSQQVVVKGQVAHREALELMRGSDIQILVGFRGPGADFQVPAKLFEYLGVGRPILALAPERGAITEVIQQSGIPGKVCDPENPEEIAAAIVQLATARNAQTGPPQNYDEGPLNRFTRRVQIGQIAGLLGRHQRAYLAEQEASSRHL